DDGGYMVVEAPEGATVPTVPEETKPVVVNDTTSSEIFFYAGTFYKKVNNVYVVVAPIAGTLVEGLPAGGTEVKVGEATFVKLGNTHYQPVIINGKNMYEVVLVEPEKKIYEDLSP